MFAKRRTVMLAATLLLIVSAWPTLRSEVNDTGPRRLIVHVDPGAGPEPRAELGRVLDARGAGRRLLAPNLPTVSELDARFPERSRRTAPESRARLERSLDRVRGIEVITVPEGVSVSEFAAELRRMPGVSHVERDAPMQLHAVPNDPYYSSSGSWGQPYDDLWGLKIIDTEPAWDLCTGSGVLVAISDTGIDYNHPDIQGRLWIHPVEDINGNGIVDGVPQDCSGSPPPNGDFDCIDNDGNGLVDDVRGWDYVNDDNDPIDDHGHGTHVGGTVAATANNGIGVVGVAYDAKLMPIKAFNSAGAGTLADGAATITYAASNGADIVSMSWGGHTHSPTLEAVVEAAADMGVVLVASAGNESWPVSSAVPASYDDVIAVAATNQNDEIVTFSNWGSGLSVSAPGGDNNTGQPNFEYQNVLSLKSAQYTMGGPTVGTDYTRVRGTSMAAPHVSGTAALLLSCEPSASRELVRIALENTADDIGAPGFDIDTGHGRVNAFSALTFLGNVIGRPELIPSITTDTGTAAPGSPVKVTLGVRNVGNTTAAGVDLDLYDGDPGSGGTLVRHITIGSIVADGSYTKDHQYVLPGSGNVDLFAVVDGTDQILEADEGNNQAGARLAVMDHQFVEQTIADDTGLSNPNGVIEQLSPAVFVDRVVWLDNRDIPSYGSPDNEIYGYTFSTGTESRITQVASRKSTLELHGDLMVFQDDRGSGTNVYAYDFSTGTETAITSDGLVRDSLDTDGGWIVYSDNRNGNADVFAYSVGWQQEYQLTTDPGPQNQVRIQNGCAIYADGGLSIKQYCLPLGPETTLFTAPAGEFVLNPDRYDGLSTWTQGSGAAGRQLDLTVQKLDGGPAEEITFGPQVDFVSRSSALDYGWVRGLFGPGRDVFVRDRATDAEVVLTQTGFGGNTMSLGLFRVAWSEMREGDSEFVNHDIFVATRDPFPAAPQSLSDIPGNKKMTLDWNDNTDPDLDVYRVYRRVGSNPSFGLRATVTSSDFVDTGLTNGTTYHYFVTAVDTAGGESAISNEVDGIPFAGCAKCPDPNQP